MVRKSKKKTSKWKLILLAVLSTILAVAIGALLLVKVFVVKDVKVEGNVLYDENLIKTTGEYAKSLFCTYIDEEVAKHITSLANHSILERVKVVD